MSDNESVVLREDREGIAFLTLNRPASRNALSSEMLNALEESFEGVTGTPSIRVAVIAGAGPGFCAGHDGREVRAADGPARSRLFERYSRMMHRITTLPRAGHRTDVRNRNGCRLSTGGDVRPGHRGRQSAICGVGDQCGAVLLDADGRAVAGRPARATRAGAS